MNASESRSEIHRTAEPLEVLTPVEILAVNGMFHYAPVIATREEIARLVLALRHAGFILIGPRS